MTRPDATEQWARREPLGRRVVAPPPLRHLFRSKVENGAAVADGASLCGVAQAPRVDVDPDSPVCPDCAARSRRVSAVIG